MANPNIVASNIIVHALIESGLRHVVFAPGSRNTPLVIAFSEQKERIKIWSQLDERSASFFALGLAIADDAPVAIICTSGSAGANMYPAIVEAHQSRVPLIVITADRPHELRHSGANQTIDQINMFGRFALWVVDAPLPETNMPDVALHQLNTLGHRAYTTANGVRKGVVHLNMPFRKPLEPDGDEVLPTLPDLIVAPTKMSVDETIVQQFVDMVLAYDKGIIVCGPRTPHDAFQRIGILARKTGFPILADGASGMRFHKHVNDMVVGGYDSFLMSDVRQHLGDLNPQIVVRFGDVPTSKWLNDYLSSITPKIRLMVRSDGTWADDQHHTTHVLHADVNTLLKQAFKYRLGTTLDINMTWAEQWQKIERTTWEMLETSIVDSKTFDGAIVADVVDLVPDQTMLFAGNSLAVRHLDQFGKPQSKRIYTYANRGASGIDGNTSTALGLGAHYPERPLVAIMGDITFYHDMNGLLAVHRLGIPITIVLLNNDGGGIFHRLPISQHDPDFTDYFVTPHGLDFSHAAKLYGLEYVQVTERDDFREAFANSINQRSSMIIEVRTDAKHDLQRRNEIVQAVHAKLATLDL
jgi:2-succinyl-5-enolpyruvyl-6-hydroxy-3-cyclohexene-1-carboxylate synthase